MKVLTDPDLFGVPPATCDQCGKHRTNEPDYNPIDVVMSGTVGWFSSVGDGEDFCPDCMAKMLNEGNRTTIYRAVAHT